ncbi:hypothetical protein DY000_02021583 [Brassica cretica]|uniref:Uncharacterized protein n=1 Tax=Brassica cretica TaxID=69181 RepID=A0ABQ7EB06_BRACR|nr:hypothetical protein DY000_02021583 [Brassica cretica]
MTHSFLERIGQPEVDLANHREESVPFNVHDATSIPEFSSSQMFSMLFRDSVVCKLAGYLKTLEYWQRDKFWDLVSGCLILCLEMLETSALGLGQDLDSWLIRLVWLEPSISPRTIFKPPGSADQKFWVSFIALLSLCRMYESHLYEMAKFA